MQTKDSDPCELFCVIHLYAVYSDGTLCMDVLQDNWSPCQNVSTILTSIQVLGLTLPSCLFDSPFYWVMHGFWVWTILTIPTEAWLLPKSCFLDALLSGLMMHKSCNAYMFVQSSSFPDLLSSWMWRCSLLVAVAFNRPQSSKSSQSWVSTTIPERHQSLQ